jgi:hypothetical protein
MNYVIEMGSGAMIYIPSFIKIGSGIQKLLRGKHIQTRIARWSYKRTFIFSKEGKCAKNG